MECHMFLELDFQVIWEGMLLPLLTTAVYTVTLMTEEEDNSK